MPIILNPHTVDRDIVWKLGQNVYILVQFTIVARIELSEDKKYFGAEASNQRKSFSENKKPLESSIYLLLYQSR